jgi:hypothetical protein
MENKENKNQSEETEQPSAIQTLLTTVIFLFAKVIIFSYILQFGWNNSLADIDLVRELTFGQSLSLYLLLSAAASIIAPTVAFNKSQQQEKTKN